MVDIERQYDRSIESLRAALGSRVGDPNLAAESPKSEIRPPAAAEPSPASGRPWWILAASLAGLLLGLALLYAAFDRPGRRAPPEGFSRVIGLAAELEGDEYLSELAASAKEYLAADVAVQEQMVALERDCAAMAGREHPALAADDRDWLRGRFADWAAQAAEIAAEGNEAEARGEAEDLLVGMVDSLHRRAALVSSR